MRLAVRFVCFLALLCGVAAHGQTQINPNTQIRWPSTANSGAPTLPCNAANYGQPYTDITNNKGYMCGSSGWFLSGGNATPGGSNCQLQLNSSGIFGGASGISSCNGSDLNVTGAVEPNGPQIDPRNTLYGVQIGTNTDQSAAMQAAINAASGFSGGATVLVPGSIRIFNAITVPSNVKLMGTGPNSNIYCSNGSTLTSICINLGTNASNVTIQDLNITADTNGTTGANEIIVGTTPQNITIRNVTITGGQGADIFFFGGNNILIDHPTLTGFAASAILTNGESSSNSVTTGLLINSPVVYGGFGANPGALTLYSCQHCTVIGGNIDENNKALVTTSGGYGVLFYTIQFTQMPITNVSCPTLTCTFTVPGPFNVSLASLTGTTTVTLGVPSGTFATQQIGTLITTTVAGVVGGTGNLNGAHICTIASTSTCTYAVSGGNTAGVNISAATASGFGFLPMAGVDFAVNFQGGINGSDLSFLGSQMATAVSPTTFTVTYDNAPNLGTFNYSNTVSITGSNGNLTGTVASGLLPPIGTTFSIDLLNPSGTFTGNLAGQFYGTVTSASTFSFQSSVANVTGTATATAYAIAYVRSAFDKVIGTHIQNAAGTGIYFQTCDFCIASNNTLSNVDQTELDTGLNAGGIIASFGFNDIVSNNVVTNAGFTTGSTVNGSCFDFTNDYGMTFVGNTCYNPSRAGLRLQLMANFHGDSFTDIGGGSGINMPNASTGSMGSTEISNTTTTGITDLGFQPPSNGFSFEGPNRISTANGSGCFDDSGVNTHIGTTYCNGGQVRFFGTGTRFTDLHVDNITAGSGLSILNGASNLHGNLHLGTMGTSVPGVLFSGQVSNVGFDNIDCDSCSGPVLQDTAGTGTTGTVTSGSNVISALASTSGMAPNLYVTDAANLFPANTTILSVNSGTGCSSACVVVSNNATGSSSAGEAITFYSSLESNIYVDHLNITSPGVNTPAVLANAFNRLFVNGGTIQGYTSAQMFSLRGNTNNSLIQNLTIYGGGFAVADTSTANNNIVRNNFFNGQTTEPLLDNTTSPGNQFVSNTLLNYNALNGVTNPNALYWDNLIGASSTAPTSFCSAATLASTWLVASNTITQTKYWCANSPAGTPTWYATAPGGGGLPLAGTTGSIGGGALTSSCASGTATVTGASTTRPLAHASATTAAAPGAFSVSAQVTATNTVTVYVCGTGTPTASTYAVSVP